MGGKNIVLLTGNPLHSNPRVVKEAAALVEAGYEVIVHGIWSEEGGSKRQTADGIRREVEGEWRMANGLGAESDLRLAAKGGYVFVPLLPPHTLEGKLHRLVQRAARKVMPWSQWTFGLMPLVLEREAKRLKPDLAIAHSEPALFAALALHSCGTKVGVDMEDWFSEDLPPEARRGRPVHLLRKAEKRLLGCAVHATCTTDAMADALATEYRCPRPKRIYNVFPMSVLPDPVPLVDRSPVAKSLGGTPSRGTAVYSIHWFSQTLGPGRGLENLFGAASVMDGCFEIHLRGNRGGYASWLDSEVPAALKSRVFIHELVTNEDLPQRIAEHDIGFAGETALIRSRDLTATNKIFQYLQSGLAVVASDTTGQREVAAGARGAVRLYRSGSRTDLQQALREWLESPEKLAAAKAAAREAAAAEFHWEKEKTRLLDVVAAALD